MIAEKRCRNCNTLVGNRRSFCSRSCWYSFKTIPVTEKICKTCGEKFQTKVVKFHDAKFCSKSCSISARNKICKNNSLERNHKIRLAILKIRSQQGGWPGKGKHEKELLDKQEQVDNCKIVRQYFVDGFFVDGYCPETNTVYEVYENRHLRKGAVDGDMSRQEKIQHTLNCNFVIIWDKEK